MLCVAGSEQQFCEVRSIRILGLQVTETNLTNLSHRKCIGKMALAELGSAPSHRKDKELKLLVGIRASPEAGTCSIPQSLWPLKSPVLGGENLIGPAKSPDHPLVRQGQDTVIHSPTEIANSCRRFRALLLEEGGMEPGQVETTDVCYIGTVISPFHKCGN